MWKQININKQNVKTYTQNAVLIQMPHNSDFDGYYFWLSSKLIRDGRHSNSVSISYTEDFTFKLIKHGKGKWNKKEIINEKIITAEEFESAFEITNDNIVSSKKDTESYLVVEEPEKIDKTIEVAECLKNNK